MAKADKCEYCNNMIPPSESLCPHCARPALYPNVRAAEDLAECKALNKRYRDAVGRATSRGCEAQVQDFEIAALSSQAVIARSIREVDRLASSDKELYATFYNFIGAGIRLPDGDEWDVLRSVTDDSLFPGYKDEIRFGALSVNGIGLSNYGECSLVLRDDMIAHRATVFEENSVLFMKHHGIKICEANDLPQGYRATWENRGKLCVAKCSDDIQPDTMKTAYADILLREGRTSGEDVFVEVHIWGPMTARTFERVVVKKSQRRADRVFLKALREKLDKVDITVEIAAEVA